MPGPGVRLVSLVQLGEAPAREVAAGGCPSGLTCAEDFPAEPDRIAAALLVERLTAGLHPGAFGTYLVCLPPPQPLTVIGTAGFSDVPDGRGRAELGYAIARSHRGRGYATAAVRALIELARRHGATSLGAEVDAANPDAAASCRVLSRSGFRLASATPQRSYFELELD